MDKKRTRGKQATQPKARRGAAYGSPIAASKILRAEAARLDVLMHAMPDKAQAMMKACVWAHNMAAAFLDSLGAPEKLVRYVPANAQPSHRTHE